MSISILHPGMLTTIQDLGRYGHQKEGILVSGAMDAIALRVANLLVGNAEAEAGLEITFLGPRIRFDADHLIALTGADLSPVSGGEPVKMNRPVFMPQGSVLNFGPPRAGSRTYLAVSGGFVVPKVLGSYATYLRAEMGGWQGRALKTGDALPCPGPTERALPVLSALATTIASQRPAHVRWLPAPTLYAPPQPGDAVVRAVQGPEYENFTSESQNDFWQRDFIVTSDSDRMGYRLQGPVLARIRPAEILSGAVTFGTIQVPAEGNPIALLADHQTTGGYPRIAQVITADFSKLAQVPMGRKIRFQPVSLAEAQVLYLQQEHAMQLLHSVLRVKFGRGEA